MSKTNRENWDRAMRKFRRLNRHFYYTEFNDLPAHYQGIIRGYVRYFSKRRKLSEPSPGGTK